MDSAGKSFAACSNTPLSVVRPLPRDPPMSARWDGQAASPALSEGPLSAASSRWNRRESTLTPGSVGRMPSRSYRDFMGVTNRTQETHIVSEMRNMMQEFSGQFLRPEGHFCNQCWFFRSEQQRLEAENRELVEALHESKKLNDALQSEIVKLESEYRVEKESEQRQNDKLKELVEDLQRDKKIAERSCEALKSEVTNLRAYISGLPSSVDFSKLKFDLYAKNQECETLRSSRSSLKTQLEARTSQTVALQEDLNTCRANCEELKLQLAKEKTANEKQERRRQLASNVDPENIETLITVRDELSIENKKLRQILVAKEKSYSKEREETKALVSEKSRQVSGLTNEVERLNGELGDASRLTEMLRSQVSSRTAERDNERELVATLKTKLHATARSQEGRQDLARLEQKVCFELSRYVQELKNLLETHNQILKGKVPDINLILGSEPDEAAKVSHLKPQDVDGRLDELKQRMADVTSIGQKIREMRHLTWDQLSSHLADTVVT